MENESAMMDAIKGGPIKSKDGKLPNFEEIIQTRINAVMK